MNTWRVWAVAHVVSGRHRERLVLIVPTCPRCRQSHTHNAALGFAHGRRKAPCGVRYTLHVDRAVERAA